MYVKTQWVDNTTPIDKNNLNKIEQGIYDNSLVVDAITDKLNPTDTETYKTAELTEGQITDVIGVNDIVIKGQTSQDGTPTPSAPVDVNVVSGSNVINTSNKNGNLFNYDKWLENKTNFDTSDFKITKDCIVSIVPTRNDTDTLTPPMPTNPTASDIKTLQWMSFPVESDTDYTIILKNENLCTMQIVRFFYRENYSYINVAQSNFSSQYAVYTFKTTADTKFVSFRFDNESYSTTAKSLKISEIQLLKGIYTTSTIPAYKPHQGKELPLDLPVENLLDGAFNQGGLDLGSAGASTSSGDRINTNFISVQPSTTYTISNHNSNIYQFGLGLYKSDETYDSTHKINNGQWVNFPYTFTTQSDTYYIRMAFKNSSSTAISPTGDYKIMLEQGSKANAYTPYGTEPIELCKIGNYQDYFYKSGSKWYLHKEVGKAILNGTENWSVSSGTGFYRFVFTNNIFKNDASLATKNILFSNMFKATNFNARNTDYNETCYQISNGATVGAGMGINTNIASTVNDFKTWLASNNVIAYYVLATPTDTEITDTTLKEQLEATYNAPLYEQTNITQTNNDLPMVLDITACKDNINGIKAFIRK